MADVSLSALPGATPTPIAAPGTVAVDGTAEGTTPFASLLTTLADPTAPAGKTPAPPLPSAAVPTALATPAVAIDPALPVASADTRAPETDVDGKAIVDATTNGPATTLAPDLSAFLALIAPPPRIAAVIVRVAAPQGGTPADGANTVVTPGAPAPTATVIPPPAPIALLSMQDAPAPRDPTAPITPTPLGERAPLASDRVMRAAPIVRTPEQATVATAAAAIGMPSVVTPVAPADEAAIPQPSLAAFAEQVAAHAAAAPVAAPATRTADPIGTSGASLLASLPTDLADPAMPAGTTRASLTISAVAAPARPIVRTDLSLAAATADPGAAQTDGDDEAAPDAGKGDPTAALAPDLGAVLAAVAPPPQIAPLAMQAVTPQRGTSSDGANRTGRPVAATTAAGIPMQPVPVASFSTRDAAPVPDVPPARNAPATTDQSATIAPDRMAQALAAVRAMTPRSPDPVAAPPATTSPAAIGGKPSEAAPVPGSASGSPATGPANAASTPPSSTMPAAGQPTAPAAAIAQAAGPVQDAAPRQEIGTAPRAPAAVVSPAGTPGIRRADPVPAVSVDRAVAASETQRPAPARARKASETVPIGDAHADLAPARIDVAGAAQTAPAPLADDPVARQLSIAHDGQWLDALAKDIAGAGNADGQLNFRLDPDHLGSLTVQLTQTADGASVRLTASTEAARTILADAQPRLVAEARAQGLTLREATVETRTAAPAPAMPADAGFGGGSGGNARGDQGGTAGQLQQQSQQQGGSRQRAPDQPRQAANPAPRAPASTRSGADLYA